MRRGIAELDGEGEVVGGIVIMRYGENALATIEGVRAKLEELKKGLPEGVEIVTTYDRGALIERAVDTLKEKLFEEFIVVSLVCVLFLLHARSALVAIITLPIGILMWDSWGSVRLAAHSLVFAAGAMVCVLVLTRRGQTRKRWMLLAVGVLAHLAFDAMWQDPETLWWPFLGWDFATSGFATYGEYVANLITDPRLWISEIAGAVYLILLWRRSGLSSAEARRTLRTSGTVSAPIGRD